MSKITIQCFSNGIQTHLNAETIAWEKKNGDHVEKLYTCVILLLLFVIRYCEMGISVKHLHINRAIR